MQEDALKLGLALGGGAARGLAHIGVLKYLEERQVVPSLVAGTSAGSIVGALYCAGLTPNEMTEIAKALSLKDLVKITIPKKGLISSSLIFDMVEDHLGDLDFAALKIPLLVHAVDLISGEKVVLKEGSVAKAVQASCAIPGIFTPVKLGRQLFVDGGLLDNVPVTSMLEKDLDYIVGVDVGGQKHLDKEPDSIFEILMQSFDIVRRQRDLQAHLHADLMVAPDLAQISIWDISKADLLIEKGYREAEKKLGSINLQQKPSRLTRWMKRRRGKKAKASLS